LNNSRRWSRVRFSGAIESSFRCSGVSGSTSSGAAFVVALALVAIVFSYGAWRRHKTTDPLAGLGPGLYQPKPDPTSQLLPLPSTNTTRR